MVAFPRSDLFDLCNIHTCTFWPSFRQEYSRTAGGQTQGKDFGSPLWRGSFTSAPLHLDQVGEIEMALLSLRGVLHSFEAHDVRRPMPLAHKEGDFVDSAEISDLGSDNKSLRLSGMSSGFTLSVGDYLAFDYGIEPNRALHRVVTPAVFDGSGQTPLFEVFPHIRPGAAIGAAVTLKRPSCLMVLDPDLPPPSPQSVVAEAIVFSGIQLIL